MMKSYINRKNNIGLHPHQTLNKRIWLMKRESGYNLTHHFSFGEQFDETLMKGYSISCQYIRLSNHQFIGFSPLNKSAGKATEVNTAHPQAGRTDFRSADRQGKAHIVAKRKRRPTTADITADTAAGFWKQKAIAKSTRRKGRLTRAHPTISNARLRPRTQTPHAPTSTVSWCSSPTAWQTVPKR